MFTQAYPLQCRAAIFDTLIKEVLHPTEKLPLRHLAVQELADHLFQLGESAHLPAAEHCGDRPHCTETAASSGRKHESCFRPDLHSVSYSVMCCCNSLACKSRRLYGAELTARHRYIPAALCWHLHLHQRLVGIND